VSNTLLLRADRRLGQARNESILVLVRQLLERALVRLGDEHRQEDTREHDQGEASGPLKRQANPTMLELEWYHALMT
jgi:hypothetical protein